MITADVVSFGYASNSFNYTLLFIESTVSGFLLVHVLFDSEERARRVAHMAIEQKLCACANIFGRSESIYVWQGAVEGATEYELRLKTLPSFREELVSLISQEHNYELPAIFWHEVRGTDDFESFIANIREKGA